MRNRWRIVFEVAGIIQKIDISDEGILEEEKLRDFALRQILYLCDYEEEDQIEIKEINLIQ